LRPVIFRLDIPIDRYVRAIPRYLLSEQAVWLYGSWPLSSSAVLI